MNYQHRFIGIKDPVRLCLNSILVIAFIFVSSSIYGYPGKRTYKGDCTGEEIERAKEEVIQEGELFQEELQAVHSEEQDSSQGYSAQGSPENQSIKETVSYTSSGRINQGSPASFIYKNEEKLLPEYEYEMERLTEDNGTRDRSRNRLPLELENRLLEAQGRINYTQVPEAEE